MDKGSFHLSFNWKTYRSFPFTNGGPSLTPCSDVVSGPFSHLESLSFGIVSRADATELVTLLAPLYRRIDKNNAYLNDPDLLGALRTLKRYAGGEPLRQPKERYDMEQLGYRLSAYLRTESPPKDLAVRQIADIFARLSGIHR